MTNLQLLLSIGIPSILIVIAWLSNTTRFAAQDKRFDAIEKRLDSHDRRFDEVITSQHKDAIEIMRNMTSLHERVAIVEANQAR